jgi:hypothetical protein
LGSYEETGNGVRSVLGEFGMGSTDQLYISPALRAGRFKQFGR